jgi:hypothetical protein
LLVLAGLPTACSRAPLLSSLEVEPAHITPNQDGDADVARITYVIGAPATLRMQLEGPDGTVYVLRNGLPRSPGAHEALFGGVVDGHMLPSGEYTLSLEVRTDDGGASTAEGDSGDQEVAYEERTLVITGGDTDPPRLIGLTVQPEEFTPNQDGIGDRVAVSYTLEEPTEVRLWLETAGGTYVTDILEEQESGEFSGEVGPHVYDYDAGVDADAPPPPDGDYVIVAEARDGAGNVSRQELPLRISSGGQPRAAIIGDVEWGDTTLPLGATLVFTATVKNVGGTPLRTRGPEPGFVYDNDQTYNQAAPREWLLLARSGGESSSLRVPYEDAAWPVELVLGGDAGPESSTAAALASTPALTSTAQATPSEAAETSRSEAADDAKSDDERSDDAPPVDEASGDAPPDEAPMVLCGTVKTADGAPGSGADVYVFESDGDNGRQQTAGPSGEFCFEGLEPVPEHQRTYSRSPGAVRLGLEYDEKRTDVAYPFRWQLGASEQLDVCETGDTMYLCVLPGVTVEVTGGVRFVEPPFRRSTSAYLALMHEDVRRMHGPYNPEFVSIEY